MPRTIKFSIKIPSLCNCKRRRETRPAEFPGVPSSIASTESFLTKSEKELSAEGQVVGTGDLRKILMNQQKDLSKLLKAYLAASKKLENYRAKDLFLEHLCREMDIEAIKKENFVPELLNAHFSVITSKMPANRAKQIMNRLKRLPMIEIVQLTLYSNLQKKIRDIEAELPKALAQRPPSAKKPQQARK